MNKFAYSITQKFFLNNNHDLKTKPFDVNGIKNSAKSIKH